VAGIRNESLKNSDLKMELHYFCNYIFFMEKFFLLNTNICSDIILLQIKMSFVIGKRRELQ